MTRSITDALLSKHYRRRRYREDAKGRWWDSRENLQVWQRSKLQKLGRVSSVNITSIRVWRCGTSTGGRSGKQGWCRLLSRGTPEPPFSVTCRSRRPPTRKCMKTSTHSPSSTPTSTSASASRPNCTTSAYYPPLNYSPLTAKITPRLRPLPSSPPQHSLGFLHRYIFSVNARLIVSTASRVYWIVINKVC